MTTAIVVGSGPNGLAAALCLADEGVEVTVLEAAPTIGGGTRTNVSTTTGLVHDDCSGFHPFGVDNAFTRRFDLGAHGLEYLHPPVQYAHPLDGGDGAAVYRDVGVTADGLGADADRYRAIFGPLTERFDEIGDEFLQPMLHLPRHPFTLARFGVYAAQPATWMARRFRTGRARGLWAGLAAHAFRSFDAPLSSAIGVALGTAAHRHGWPVARGGSQAIADAMATALGARGGRIVTDTTVGALDELGEADVVLLDTSPRAAAAILGDRQPRRAAKAYRRFRHGPGAFQVAFAVEGGIPWRYEPARRAGTVHVGGDFEEIATAEARIWSGRAATRPFVLVGQQYLADPDRASGDLVPVDTYAHVPAGNREDLTDAVTDQIERFAPGFTERIRHVETRSTRGIEAHNPNYVNGDILTGANTATQLVFRPRVALDPYPTGAAGVFLCSAATPPGAGAHGLCGWHAARSALAYLERRAR